MTNKGGAIHFEITANNDDLKRKLADSRLAILNSGKAAEEQGSKIEGMFKRVAIAQNTLGKDTTLARSVKEVTALAEANRKLKELIVDNSDAIRGNTDVSNGKVQSLSLSVGGSQSVDINKGSEVYWDMQSKLNEQLDALYMESWQNKINIEADGFEKSQRQTELNYSRELMEIERYTREQIKLYQEAEREKYKAAHGGSDNGFVAKTQTVEDLPQEIRNNVDGKINSATKDYANANKKLLSDLTSQWQTLGDKYQQIDSQIAATSNKAVQNRSDIAAAVASGGLTQEQGDSATQVVDQGEQAALKELEMSKTKLSADWIEMFRNLDGMSRVEVQKLISAINIQLSNSELSPADTSLLLGQLDKAKDYSGKLNPFVGLINGIKDAQTATENLEVAKQKLEQVKSSGGSESEIAAATQERITAEEALDVANKRRNNSASSSIKDVAGVAGETSKLLKSFGVESPAVDGVISSLSALGEINFSNPMSIITGGLKAVSSLLGGIFGEMDAVKERKIQEIQQQVNELTESYETLGKEITKAYSSNASNLIGDSNEMLEQQNKLIEQQKQEEQSKKNSDQGKLANYDKAIAANNKKIEDNKAKAVDAIFGSDLKSAINDFAKAYMDAWATGEDRAAAQKDVVKKMIRGIIQEMLKSDIQKQVEDMRKQIEGFMSDDVLSDSELAEIDKLGEEIGQTMETRGQIYDKILQNDKPAKQNEDSLSGQIRGSVATEQSVAELGGIFRGQYEKLSSLDRNMELGVTHMLEIARTNLLIEANTHRTANNTDGLTTRIDDTNRRLDIVIKNTQKDYAKS